MEAKANKQQGAHNMRINPISGIYPYRRVEKVKEIFSENKNRENSRRFGARERWTCAHCRVGIVERLPARCPECDKLLNKAISTKSDK